MRFVVFGAGGVGGVVGGRLFQHGHDVTLVARGDHLATMKAEGLRLESPDDTVTLDVPTASSAADVDWRSDDVCLLSVKSQDTSAALDALAAVAPPELPIACAQNGVDNERQALRRFARVYGVCVMLPATFLRPGVVQASSAPVTGALNVGRYPHGTDEVCSELAAAFSSASFLAEPDDRIMEQKYAKLLMNLGNAVEAVCGTADRDGELLRRTRSEALGVLQAAGIAVAAKGHDAEQRRHISIRPIAGERRGGGSTWQSLARGTDRVETDHLNGEIVLLGRLHGVPTPANALLQRLAGEFARQHRQPGSVTEAEVTAMLPPPPTIVEGRDGAAP